MIICCVESHYSEDTYHLFLDGPKKKHDETENKPTHVTSKHHDTKVWNRKKNNGDTAVQH